jgi:glycosyltransferase involved in cell wall biosynthesis
MKGPDVAIITRTQDRPITLDRTIRGVLGQRFPNWQMMVVSDQGNLPSIQRVIERHAGALSGRARVLHREHSVGMEAATNHGIANSMSRYIAVHDDDDTWHCDFLVKAVAYLEASDPSTCGVVTGTELVLERFAGNQLVEVARRTLPLPALPMTPHLLRQRNPFPPISFLFRRSALEKVGLYREDLSALGDWEFNIRFVERFKVGVIPDTLAFWHIRRGARGAHRSYANSSYWAHLRALMKLKREWGQPRPLWRYILLWRY